MFPQEYCIGDRYGNEIDPLIEEMPGFIMDVEVSQKRLANYQMLLSGEISKDRYKQN